MKYTTVLMIGLVGLAFIGISLAMSEKRKDQVRADIEASVDAELHAEREACIAQDRAQQVEAAARFRRDLERKIDQSKDSDALKAAQRAVFEGVGVSGAISDIVPLHCNGSLEDRARRIAARLR